jgi:asparagine synthase (glutamine-hydrolysing)
MCGIAGLIMSVSGGGSGSLEAVVTAMADRIRHRGPDDAGIWVDAATGIGLSHRRLSIVDLSPAGHQPMHSASGRLVVVFNGEIYNFQELRRDLEKSRCKFRGHSDTEVLLAAIELWGLEETLRRAVGMFAFAVWDKQQQTLSLARDRMGEKPLYYGWAAQNFMFASELKAFAAVPGWSRIVNRDALALYFHLGYVPAPLSIFQNISKLPPGAFLQLKLSDIKAQNLSKPTIYWSVEKAAMAGLAAPFAGTEEDAVDRLDELLRETISKQMLADVPVGAFLSGGIDSSTVVAVMQTLCSQCVKTFTIGFRESAYNEAEYAASIAAHLKTDHTELYLSSNEALDHIPEIPEIYDEPFSDSSQIPTWFVSNLARRRVTVSLSGDGGDELFGGYTRYPLTDRLWQGLSLLPRHLRRSLSRVFRGISVERWNQTFGWMADFVTAGRWKGRLGDRCHKLADLMDISSGDDLYQLVISHWKKTEEFVLKCTPGTVAAFQRAQTLNCEPFLRRMMYADSVSYLPDDILTKLDRATMAVSLESRVPLLDHRIVEFSWSLPARMVSPRHPKRILRQLLYRYVPRALVERPKMGFGVPLGEWLRGPLREWADNLLSPTRLDREGFVQSSLVKQCWDEHLSSKRNWQYYLWDVLMFEVWFERHARTDPEPATPVAEIGMTESVPASNR